MFHRSVPVALRLLLRHGCRWAWSSRRAIPQPPAACLPPKAVHTFTLHGRGRPSHNIAPRGAIGCLLLLLCGSSPLAAQAAVQPDKSISFQEDVLPIFQAKCIRCHAGVEPKADLNLTRPSAFLIGGKSGALIRIRAAESSLLYEKISSDQMPPEGQKLTDAEKGVIRQWINDGADGVDRAATIDRSEDIAATDHWSFKPPQRPSLPSPSSAAGDLSNPIDAFVARALQKEGLTFAPQADRLTLLRRASFDLLGLPPTPEQVAAFLEDRRPDAYMRMIDRLLASPRYGERWARHWLDVAGYADSAGILFEDRVLQRSFRFRDYVIRAFNSDKPYDRFLLEQFAGDELTDYWSAFEREPTLPPEVVEGITATGFLRTAADASRPDFQSIKNAEALYYYPTIFDTLQIACSTTMGLTIQCARCHSHKFDPISQVDYYQLQAVLTSAYRPDQWVPQMNRMLPIASKQQLEVAKRRNSEVDANIKRLNEKLAEAKAAAVEQIANDALARLPAAIRDDVKAAIDQAADKRTTVQKYLADKFAATIRPTGKQLDELLAKRASYQAVAKATATDIAAEQRRRHAFDEVRALYDLPGETTTPVLLRGDPLTPGPPVSPGVIDTLETPEPFQWSDPGEGAKTSGRRLAFARWLTQPGHPLTSRVMVNRIWMHHFGAGLVATPDDFGVAGAYPSHPELLDWLAVEFIESGWQIKQLHRTILSSRTWKQASRVSPATRDRAEQVDPGNRLLWRQNLRRLEAEPIRDSAMAVAGVLSSQMYGFPATVARQASGEVIVTRGPQQYRRSVYVQILRLNPQTLLEAFDQPVVSVNCTQRSTSTVATQALTLLNSNDMVDVARKFAAHLLNDVPLEERGDPADATFQALASSAVMRAYSRPALPGELAQLAQFLDEQTKLYRAEKTSESEMRQAAVHAALADLCHLLISSNEFVYID